MTEPTTQTRFISDQDRCKESPWTVQDPRKYAPVGVDSSLSEAVMPDDFPTHLAGCFSNQIF